MRVLQAATRWLLQVMGVNLGDKETYRLSTNLSQGAVHVKSVFPRHQGPSILDTPLDSPPKRDSGNSEIPEIKVHKFLDAYFKPTNRFNAVYSRNQCLIAGRHEPGPWDFGVMTGNGAGKVLWQSRHFIETAKARRREFIPKGIYVGSRAPYNYYHWIVNALPSLFIAHAIAKVNDDYPAIIPRAVLENENLLASVRAISGEREIYIWDNDVELHVREAVVVNPPPVYDTPLSLLESKRTPLACHTPLMRLFREAILDGVDRQRSQQDLPERIFVARPEGGTRSSNQKELIEIAEGYGFSIFRPEEHCFADQVATFHSAEYIAGPGGAAFTNLLFCSGGAKALLWKPRHISAENPFANLASIANSTLYALQTQAANGSDKHLSSPWFLEPTRLASALKQLVGHS